MGNTSSDSLEAYMIQFIKRCRVVGDRIVVEGDPTAPGHRPPNAPVQHPILEDPLTCGKDWKRGQ